MVKSTGIFAIVYMCYCEINADVDKLKLWQPTTANADARNAYMGEKNLTGDKSDGMRLRNFDVQRRATTKFTMGFRADISDPPNIELIVTNGKARNNDSELPVVKSRRRKKLHRNKNNNRNMNDHNANRKPNLSDIVRNINKHYQSTRNRETKGNKNHNQDRKHFKYKIQNKVENHSIARLKDEKHVKQLKHSKDNFKHKIQNKAENHSIARTMDEKHVKHSKHSKDVRHERENDHINKKKQAKDKNIEILKVTSIIERGKDARTREPERTSNINLDTIQVSLTIPKQKSETEIVVKRVLASTRTTKLQPVPVQVQVADKEEKRKSESKQKPLLGKLRVLKVDDGTHNTRSTKILTLNNQDDDKGYITTDELSGGSPPLYLSPYAIMTQLKLIIAEFPNVNATFETLGRTVEYNDIVIIKISEKKNETAKYFRTKESKYIDEVPEKKIIFIVHGLTVMGMNYMNNLIYKPDLKILLSYYFKHLDKFDIFLIPLANPDGYSRSLSNYALWNKNMSPQSACPGVFLDRNFDVAWNFSQRISSCSQLYPGATAFSEVESKAVRDIFHYYSHKILAYIHVHSGTYNPTVFKGDAVLYPHGYTESQSDDDKYIDMKGEIDEVMKNASFRVMTVAVDTLFNWYGKVSGSSVDYASAVYGIPYALEFVMQLYTTGSESKINRDALTEIWGRLIDTTFNNMWKSTQRDIDARKK